MRIGVAKVKAPLAEIGRLSPPLSRSTRPVPVRPETVPPMVYAVGHTPPLHAPSVQTLPHVPQLLSFELTSTSQPSLSRPLQSLKPGSQT